MEEIGKDIKTVLTCTKKQKMFIYLNTVLILHKMNIKSTYHSFLIYSSMIQKTYVTQKYKIDVTFRVKN